MKYVVLAIVAVLVIAGGLYLYGGSQVPPGQPPLRSVTAQSLNDVKNQFNAAKDEVRVLLLLSPT